MQVKEPKPWQLIDDYATVARVAAKARFHIRYEM